MKLGQQISFCFLQSIVPAGVVVEKRKLQIESYFYEQQYSIITKIQSMIEIHECVVRAGFFIHYCIKLLSSTVFTRTKVLLISRGSHTTLTLQSWLSPYIH